VSHAGERLARELVARLGEPPSLIVRAPGRVNLIGEHTDYNHGFVLPMAIDRGVLLAARPRHDTRLVLHSLQRPEVVDLDLRDPTPPTEGWGVYVAAVARVLGDAGVQLLGLDGIVAGEIPAGAGLSSSAALELAVCQGLLGRAGVDWPADRMALECHRAERDLVGVQCGVMDQLACALGRSGHAMLIDCRSLEVRLVELPDDVGVIVLDTGKRRDLASSEYNQRRSQCELAAQHLEVTSLRQATLAQVESGGLDEVLRRRALHVVTENDRTTQAADALARADAEVAGRLMNESHASLRNDFEVSTRELDKMVEIAQRHDACLGARMTGAGFGGCAVALVRRSALAPFVAAVRTGYAADTGIEPDVYICKAAAGVDLEQ
jgi:galactokinase